MVHADTGNARVREANLLVRYSYIGPFGWPLYGVGELLIGVKARPSGHAAKRAGIKHQSVLLAAMYCRLVGFFLLFGRSIQSRLMTVRTMRCAFLSAMLLAPGLRADPLVPAAPGTLPAAEFRDGHWQSIAPPAPPPPAFDPDLDQMQHLLDAGDGPAALAVGLYWIKTHHNKAPLRDRALYLVALAKAKTDSGDDRVNAYYYLDELMDEYPESKLFYPALQEQYAIAEDYLDGHKGNFLGLRVIPMQEEAIEMMYRIQQRSPGSPLAEKALLRTCDYYYSTSEYELAHDAYGFYIKTYPRSPIVAQVKLRQAFSSLAQFRGVRFDPTSMIEARVELSNIIAAYPSLAKEENLSAIIARIDESLARKMLITGDFYQRTHADRGAVYVYRSLLDAYPDSTDAAKAKKALATMPKSALADSPPRSSVASPEIDGPPLPGRGS